MNPEEEKQVYSWLFHIVRSLMDAHVNSTKKSRFQLDHLTLNYLVVYVWN